MSEESNKAYGLTATYMLEPTPSDLRGAENLTALFDKTIVRNKNINFKTEFKISENRVIRFNKDTFVPVAPNIYGEINFPNNIEAYGVVWTEERQRYPVYGDVPFPNEISLEGSVSFSRVFEIQGEIPLQSFTLAGAVDIFTPFYFYGEITLSSNTQFYGEVKYYDDVFRGIRNDTQAINKSITGFTRKELYSYWTPSLPTYTNVPSFFDDCTKVHGFLDFIFNDAVPLKVFHNAITQDGIPITDNWGSSYDDGIRLKYKRDIKFNDAVKIVPKSYAMSYDDMVRLRASTHGDFRDGVLILLDMFFGYRVATPFYFSKSSYFQWAAKIVAKFVRSPVIPPEYEKPKPTDKNIRFRCPFRARTGSGDFNIYFNMTTCKKPYVINENGVYIVDNSLSAIRVIDSQPFTPLSLSIDTDMASWCWSMSATIEAKDVPNVIRLEDEIPLLEFTVNGDVYRFILEEISRARQWGNMEAYTLTGRSISSLLSSPMSDPITFTNPAEISAVQLVQQIAANAVGNAVSVHWENVVSDIGWVLPANAVSISNKSPIEAIAEIVKPVGAIVFTHPSQPVIVIKKAYPYAHWETPLSLNHTLAEGVITRDGSKWDKAPLKNGVYITDPSTGDSAKVYRRGTSGDKLAPEVVSSILSTIEAKRDSGKDVLTQAAPSETTSMSFPFLPLISHVYPCDTLAITTEDGGSSWGTITNVSINATVDNENVNINYSVSVKKFMETSMYV